MTYFGRRTIYLSGMVSMCLILTLIGLVSVVSYSQAAIWIQAALCLVWQLVYSLTVGPITYSIISETSTIHLRAKTVVLARNTYNLVTIVSLVAEPYVFVCPVPFASMYPSRAIQLTLFVFTDT